ncbi:MAG TPA: 6-bladed beta-propeller [Gammaproteobacteria bacterium]
MKPITESLNRCALYPGLVLALLLTACASREYRVDYEVQASDAQVWPAPPEIPRFRYVGTLTGEDNVKPVEEGKRFGDYVTDFFRWVVGLVGPNPIPLVLQRPQSGVMDDNGRLYITDVSRQSIMVFDLQKGTLTEWEQATPNTGFLTPVGITLGPAGSILVVDADLKQVLQLDATGKPVKAFGADTFKRPTGIARDPVKGRIYVADTHAHDIKVFDDNGALLNVFGEYGTDGGEFNSPAHLSFAEGLLYVTDTFNTRVQVLRDSGEFRREFGKRGLYVGDLVRPKGVATDSEGNIYVIESFHDHLLVYSANGEFLLPIGGTGAGIGQFYLPSGVWTDKNDRIYIADMFNGRVVILQYLGGRYARGAVQNAVQP